MPMTTTIVQTNQAVSTSNTKKNKKFLQFYTSPQTDPDNPTTDPAYASLIPSLYSTSPHPSHHFPIAPSLR